MKRSDEKILVSHAGRLSPENPEFRAIEQRKSRGEDIPDEIYLPLLETAIKEMIQHQVDLGVDVLSDGEAGRFNTFAKYGKRIDGIIYRECRPDEVGAAVFDSRERKAFPEFYEAADKQRYKEGAPTNNQMRMVAVDAMKAKDIDIVKGEIARFRKILTEMDLNDRDAFFPMMSPGWLHHFIWDEHYNDEEEFLFALAEVMRPEYEAIAEAGFILQLDGPDLPDKWATLVPNITLEEYRKKAKMRVDATNHAIRNIPEEKIRYHLCWGSWNGPHVDDIPFRDVVDLMLEIKAQAYSFEAGNVRHEHEWKIWQDVKLPEGKILIPGVVSHRTNSIEHPEVVAARLENFASCVGRENVIAGTDCGMGGGRMLHEIGWAKIEAMVEGSALASRHLWGETVAA
jgi:5-methyltetrahydropteroyltriglutamate--homocysteine methyltransferase